MGTLVLNLDIWETFFNGSMRGGKIIPGGMGGIFKTKELKCTDFVQRKNKPGAVLKSPAVRILALIYRGLRLSLYLLNLAGLKSESLP